MLPGVKKDGGDDDLEVLVLCFEVEGGGWVEGESVMV